MKRKAGGFDFSVIRKLRKRDGLTLQDVSDRSGIGLSVLSKIERNMSRAELPTLRKLAGVFGLTASDLIALAEEPASQIAHSTPHQSGSFEFREIRFGSLRGLEGRAPKGATLSRPEIHRDDYELCWVLDGRLRVSLPDEKRDLRSGDAMQFDAVWAHTYAALEDCHFLILHMARKNRFTP